MSIGIRTLKSRLKKIEQKSGAGNSKDFYASLTDEQLEAVCQLTDAELEEGEVFTEDEAISFLTECLDGDERTARYLWLTQQSLPPDPEFQRMSDAELTELIIKTRERCNQLDAEMEEVQ